MQVYASIFGYASLYYSLECVSVRVSVWIYDFVCVSFDIVCVCFDICVHVCMHI